MKKLFGIVLALSVGTLLAQNTWQAMFPKNNNVAAASSSTVNPYLFPLVGTGLVDVWRFNMASGNLVSSVKAQTYTVNDPIPSLTYLSSGPNSLIGVSHVAANNSGGFKLASQTDTDFDVGAAESFTILIQFTSTNNSDTRWLIDFGTNAAANTGVTVLLGDTRLTIYTIGALGNHFARTDVGTVANDGTFYTARIVYDRANASPKIYLKAQGASEVDMTVSRGGTGFNAMGAVTITTDAVTFFGPNSQTTSMWFGKMFQVAYSKGTTYDATIKP